jgi:diadenosine tetraphosphate (Ap4A) HIT family hydrolase
MYGISPPTKYVSPEYRYVPGYQVLVLSDYGRQAGQETFNMSVHLTPKQKQDPTLSEVQ